MDQKLEFISQPTKSWRTWTDEQQKAPSEPMKRDFGKIKRVDTEILSDHL